MNTKHDFLNNTPELAKILDKCPSFIVADNVEQLIELSCGNPENDSYEVKYDLPNNKTITEANVVRVRNGISVNYPEPYMRRRDPDCMIIGDDKPSDKPKFKERYGKEFSGLRTETFDWLVKQDLCVFAFRTGHDDVGENAIAVVPLNGAFFGFGLAMLQGIISTKDISEDFIPKSIIYVAPTFRHTHFDGKQIVVHNRKEHLYEIFAYNLYPGPSAKKGVYGVLIDKGEHEGWVVPHCSAVQIITPYDNVITFMHEGASGSGKSEMLEQPHRLLDGRMLKGYNLVTGEKQYIEIPRTCELKPVCDDMALCTPSIQKDPKKLWIMDAENGWFLRINHITKYGTDPNLEKLSTQPKKPLFFLNIDAAPNSTALIWEHTEDAPGKPCPNPRIIVPREIYPDSVSEPVAINYRSFGVRTPPCTKENPSYGIIGLFHILPPALAWLWRLVAPRGFSNPSIVDDGSMASEGVGSYWAFSTGLRVNQANLLLKQFEQNIDTKYVLIPNQNIGAWKTGFMPQWLTRDYLARRGLAKFNKEQIKASRCSLLGYSLKSMRIEGVKIGREFLEVDTQPEVGQEAYDKGAKILNDFFRSNLSQFMKPELNKVGRKIIECCLDNGNVNDYAQFSPNNKIY